MAQVTVTGSASCGVWVERRAAKTAIPFEFWLLGYLSGVASGTNIEFFKKGGSSLDSQSIELWMDNYCKANPLKRIFEGANVLFKEHSGN